MPRKPIHRAASRQRHPVVLAVVAGTVGTLLAQWPEQVAAQATQAAEQAFDIDLPAQPLPQALAALSRQTGVQVFAAGELVSGRMAPVVRGRLRARQALDQVLAGSGLVGVAEGSTWVVRPAPTLSVASEPMLPAVTARATTAPLPGEPPKPYAGGQVARGGRLGMLGNIDLFDTPFSTKAYTSRTVQDQGAQRADEILQNDPSIRSSTSQGQRLDQSSIRGFLVYSDDYRFDGVAGLFGYGFIPVQNYERVEVIKGPNAMLSGVNSVGGVVNFVPKRALDQPSRQLTGFATDDGQLGTQLDLGQRFGVDNALGARLNVYAADGDGYAENMSSRVIAPLLALDYRGERFRALLDVGITDGDDVEGTPNMRFSDTVLPGPPDPRLAHRRSWETTQRRSTFGMLTFENEISSTWNSTLKLGRETTSSYNLASVGLMIFDNVGNFTADPYSYGFEIENKVIDAGLSGNFTALGAKHRLAFNATRHDEDHRSYYIEGATFPSNIYAPLDAPDPALPKSSLAPTSNSRLTGFGVADTVSSTAGRVALTFGVRHQRVEAFDVYGSPPYDESKLSPAVALLFKPQAGLSLYANYIEALTQGDTAPVGTENQNATLPPIQTKQMEVGAKWDFGNWGLTTALFDIRQPFGLIGADNVYSYAGEQRNRGLEIETFGEHWKGIRLLGGVAFLDGKQTKTEDGATDGKRAIGIPKVQLNLGTEWDVAALPGLTLTGRLTHTAKAYYDASNTVEVPSWRRFDLGLRYRTSLVGRATTFRANLGNATDDRHWEIAGRNLLTISAPRSLRVSATVDF